MKKFLKNKFLILIIFVFPSYHFAAPVDNSFFELIKYFFRGIIVFHIFWNYKFVGLFNIRKNSSYLFYCFYIILSGISLIYSSDFFYSIIKFVDLLIITLFTIVLYNKNRGSEGYILINILNIYLIGYILMFFLIGFYFYPFLFRTMGEDGVSRLGGYLINPNLLAYVLICIILINTYFLKNNYRVYLKKYKWNRFLIYIILISSLYLLFITYSRSGYVCLLFVMFLYILQTSKSKFKWISVFLISIITTIFISFNLNNLLNIYLRGEENSLTTLSGRLPIWKELWANSLINEYLFFGHGFQMLSEKGIGVTVRSFDGGNSDLTMAHNNIFQVLLGLGIVGLIISFLVFVKVFKDIKKIPDYELRLLYKNLLIVLIFFSLVEYGVYGPNNILIFLFIYILYSSSIKYYTASYD